LSLYFFEAGRSPLLFIWVLGRWLTSSHKDVSKSEAGHVAFVTYSALLNGVLVYFMQRFNL
jgi:hypothetical protein